MARNLMQVIAELMDLDPNEFGYAFVSGEFNHKYQHTTMVVNGDYVHITGLNNIPGEETYYLRVMYMDGKTKNITELYTIEPFLPKTGLYKRNNTCFYLGRLPKKQWKRSFSLNNNYGGINIGRGNDFYKIEDFINFLVHEDTQFHKETMEFKGNLYLYWKKIGFIDTKTFKISLRKNTFEKEIAELWPQYKIISDAPFQKVEQDANLRVDFF